jgi:hypothetical protein
MRSIQASAEKKFFDREYRLRCLVTTPGGATYGNLPLGSASSQKFTRRCVNEIPYVFYSAPNRCRFNALHHRLRFNLIFTRDGVVFF